MASSALAQSTVALITTTACPYCRKAKSALKERQIPFDEYDASYNNELRAATAAFTGQKTVPQIFVQGKSIGGCDALMENLESGAFQTLVASSAGLTPLPSSLAALIGEGKSTAAQSSLNHELQSLRTVLETVKSSPLTGSELIQALQSTGEGSRGPDMAQSLAKSLLRNNLISSSMTTGPPPSEIDISPKQEYFIVSKVPLPARSTGLPLNRHYQWYGPARPAPLLSSHLRGLILDLYEKHLSPDGKSVSYKSMSEDPFFRRFVDATAELQSVDLTTLQLGGKEEELVAFFINLYNVLVVHALAAWGGNKGMSFYSSIIYDIGGLTYSADDMENGVLRGNKPGAANPWALIGFPQMSKGQFPEEKDPRRRVIALKPDARIHFALNCGAKSCPPIRVFTADNLDEGLEAAAESFCSSEVKVDKASKEVRVSKIFKWYAPDFGANTIERLRFIRRFLRGQARDDLDALLAEEGGKGIKLGYLEYDWGLNGK
jgi:glutaredoxin